MTREDDIRARLDVLPWASWATVDKDDLRWLLAEVERLTSAGRVVAEARRMANDRADRWMQRHDALRDDQ